MYVSRLHTLQPKLGKKPARRDAVKLKLTNYVDVAAVLPQVPAEFGHEVLIPPKGWGMLGNDQYGDCVWAGAAHETMLWNREVGKTVVFNDKHVLADYSKVTGFNPADPNTDQGTDMELAAKYRRKTGVHDASGHVHKVAAYLDIKAGDIQQHLVAAYLFGAVGIGIEFPASAMDQFNKGQPWDVVKGSPLDGGHYIPFVAHRGANFVILTWGQIQLMTPKFFSKYNDESVVYLSTEMLTGGKSLEGFDLAALQADLAQVTKVG